MVLDKLGLLKSGLRLMNCAPEPFMIKYGAERLGSGYIPTDYDPALFAKWKVPIRQLDLCDPRGVDDASLDCVMHNHVLEHLPCAVSGVLRNLNRFIALGGYHLFSTPIMPDRFTVEDLNPNITAEDRRRRFGQDDHVRMFGSLDFSQLLESAGMLEGLVDLSKLIGPDDLEMARLNPAVFETYNSHRVFAWQRRY